MGSLVQLERHSAWVTSCILVQAGVDFILAAEITAAAVVISFWDEQAKLPSASLTLLSSDLTHASVLPAWRQSAVFL